MRVSIILSVIIWVGTVGCGGEKDTASAKKEDGKATPTRTKREPKTVPKKEIKPPTSALLVAQSQFKADKDGAYTKPDAASLLVLKQSERKWVKEQITDKESNVFHKALPYGNEGILTLGANEALLKLWRKKEGSWQSETLWHPKFGGKHNRLRDFEIADFDGDGNQDLAIATHDQGVVAVVWRRGDKWEPQELDRQKDIFVHEIEIGDLNKNGKLEIYATPSDRNRLHGKAQGGKVVQFEYDGEAFKRTEVVSLATRHVKEILVADVDEDGTQELYAAIEAKVEEGQIKEPVEIRRFDLKGDTFKARKVTTITDRFCRFLVAGDVDRDGATELVAASFSAGVWVIEHEGNRYTSTCIDKRSSGFEHAAYVADLNEDGDAELYVADDQGGVIRQYEYKKGQYRARVLHRRAVPSQAMVWNITQIGLDLI